MSDQVEGRNLISTEFWEPLNEPSKAGLFQSASEVDYANIPNYQPPPLEYYGVQGPTDEST